MALTFSEIFVNQGAPPASTILVANLPLVSTTSVAKLPPVSTTLAANFPTCTAGVIATGVNDTGSK
jgi:hypothetical protein